jgi:hypothetical protein
MIFYAWGNAEEAAERWTIHVSGRFAIVVPRNQEDALGEWVDKRRDLATDYRAAWEDEPGPVAALGFMLDTDDSAQRGVGLLGRVEWHEHASRSGGS